MRTSSREPTKPGRRNPPRAFCLIPIGRRPHVTTPHLPARRPSVGSRAAVRTSFITISRHARTCRPALRRELHQLSATNLSSEAYRAVTPSFSDYSDNQKKDFVGGSDGVSNSVHYDEFLGACDRSITASSSARCAEFPSTHVALPVRRSTGKGANRVAVGAGDVDAAHA